MEILLKDIIVEDRQRKDYGDLSELQESLRQYGTIQPIVLEQLSSGAARLIAGGRRYAALCANGATVLYHASTYDPARPGFVLGSELTEEQLAELELEENIRRKAMSWQEECLSIAKVHRLRVIRGNPDGGRWTREQTGRLMNIALGSVSNMLWAAGELSKPDSPLWQMDGITAGLQWKLQKEQELLEAELARRHAERSQTFAESLGADASVFDTPPPSPIDSDDKIAARERYLSNPHNDPDKFEEYYAERQTLRQEPPKIYLSPRLHHGDCLTFLASHPGRFDHIITDPPYAIDMDNLSQTGVGMKNINSVEATHQVSDNLSLLFNFFPRAYSALKADGFLVLWCDYAVWQQLYDWATAAGFKVQRWPLTWVKLHACMNSAANYNFTKTTEIAMICRKGNAQMVQINTPSHILASHDDFKTEMDHPFVKPFAVWEHVINAVSIRGQSILDPFAGEGSGVISALRLDRNYFGCELESHHYNKLLENVKKEFLRLDPGTTFI